MFPEAIESYREALILARKTNAEVQELQCLMELGILYWNIGSMKKSLDMSMEALPLARRLNLKARESFCQKAIEVYHLYLQGKNFRMPSAYRKSIEHFRTAIGLSRNMGSLEHEVKCLRQLSLTYWEMNEIEEFFDLNERALKLARLLKHKQEEGRCLNNIGLYYWKIDNYLLSLKKFEEALEIAQKTGNKYDQAICLSNIGTIYIDMGYFEKALEHLLKALSLDEKYGYYSNIGKLYNNIGEAYRRKGIISESKSDLIKALDYFDKSLEIANKNADRKTEVEVLNNIGAVHIHLEEHKYALKYFQSGFNKSNEIKDKETMSNLLNNMGNVYLNLGNHEEAVKLYQRAIDLALKSMGRQVLWEAYFGLGQIYEKRNEYAKALDYYRKSIAIIEEIRSRLSLDTYKASFVRNKLKVYGFLMNLLYKRSKSESTKETYKEMFQVVEKAKARAFLEALGEARIDIKAGLSPHLREKEKEISGRIASIISDLARMDIGEKERQELLRNLDKEEDEYVSLISRMRMENPEVAGLVSPEPAALEKIQRELLDEKTALVEYFLGEDNSFVFFITRDDIELHRLPSWKEIENSIKIYLKIISTPPRGEFSGLPAARRLFREFLFPLEGKRGLIENLIIIPDGMLYYLPFETLVFDDPDTAGPPAYLIQEFRVSYGFSASSLLLLNGKDVSEFPKRLLAFGNPVYQVKAASKKAKVKTYEEVLRELYLNQGFDFSPLPYSRKEILKISRYFPKKQRDVFLGKKASEDVVKKTSLKDYQILHFACHGFLDETFPFRSALVLSRDGRSEEDGFLQVREIYNLRLNADLVVLSACQTGKGSLERIEGLLGLPRIFFYAGARSVLSTLWRISDKSTALFMDAFYRYMAEGNDKGQALRLAKLKMINSRFSHPFYWAAFVLNGNNDSPHDPD